MNLSRRKQSSKAAFALAGAVVVAAAAILIPDFQGTKRETPRVSAAGQDDALSKENHGAAGDVAEYEMATGEGIEANQADTESGQVSSEEPVTGSVEPKQKEVDDTKIREETIRLNGVPVTMRWQADTNSAEEMEALAELVYDEFAGIYLEGERRPEQMYGLARMSCDFETAEDFKNMFSDKENPMIWRLFGSLPDNWKEDGGMGMMQQEESREQEYDMVLVKNKAGEWEVAESAWRAYYDDKGNFRWPD